MARLLSKSALLEVKAPSSSIETHKFIAKGFAVNERISAITLAMACGVRPWAPNDPKPPKLETAAASRCVVSPPSGP